MRRKKPPAEPIEGECPKCGSKHIGGLMQGFFVALGENGSPVGDWNDWSSETELGTERLCYDCDHQWGN